MLTVLATILPLVSRCAHLSSDLYRIAAESSEEATEDLLDIAGSLNRFASILKQVGTIIKEDDRLPSHEVRRLSGTTL